MNALNRQTRAGRLARRRHSRRGIALILVIGMLALMVVLGVAFSIFMRTERLAAGNFRNDVIARQLMQVALQRAMSAIEADTAGCAYPRSDVLASPGVTAVPEATNAPVADWVPESLFRQISTNLPKWIPVSFPNGGGEGRVGYLVFNCSGLVDVNHAGGVPRGLGTNVAEIQIADLPEVSDDAALISERPYETQQELLALATNTGNGLGDLPSNLVTYSAFTQTNVAVDLSGDDTALANRGTQITEGLIRSGIAASQAGSVLNNLLDYVDSNCIPRDLASPCTEAVPMINEVQVSNTVVFIAGGTCRSVLTVFVEWFYPFIKSTSQAFEIGCDIEVSAAPGTPGIYVPPSVIGARFPVNMPIGATSCFGAVSTNLVTPPVSYTNNDQVQLVVRVGAQTYAGVNVVDSVPYPNDPANRFSFTTTQLTIPAAPSGLLSGAAKGAECIDPRFNWNPTAGAGQWAPYPNAITSGGSRWTTNWVTRVTMTADPSMEKSTEMYVADAPLRSPAELSYLVRGRRTTGGARDLWSTIKLCDDTRVNLPIDRVLDNFAMGTNTAFKGRLNPNTRSVAAMTAVLDGMRVDAYPGESNAPSFVLSQNQAAQLAGSWVQMSGLFTNLSDIGRATNLFVVAPLTGLSAFRKESLIRNTCGLLHPGQSYYMILLFAQATKVVVGVADRGILSHVRGLAEVWRSPYPAADGTPNPVMVRMIRVLDQQ